MRFGFVKSGLLYCFCAATFCAHPTSRTNLQTPNQKHSNNSATHKEIVHTETTKEGFKFKVKISAPSTSCPDKRWPGVLLIPGSMPSDVDHTLPGKFHGKKLTVSGNEIALWPPFVDALNRAGFVVARYGKRGVRKTLVDVDALAYRSTSMTNQIIDTRRALSLLREHPCVDKKRLALLAWSEGTIVAPRVADVEKGIRTLVLIGAVGSSFRELIIDGFPTQKKGEAFVQSILQMPDQKMIGTDRPAIRVKEIIAQGANTSYIRRLKIPVFVAHGRNDAETPVKQARLIEKELGNVSNIESKVKIYPGLGHILSPIDPDDPTDRLYDLPDPGALKDIVDWLKDRLIPTKVHVDYRW
ncbi:MAG: acyl-CoA thioester hydrolase/BAAT C-terminal domain-containing protein [Pseudomonadota bacterium]